MTVTLTTSCVLDLSGVPLVAVACAENGQYEWTIVGYNSMCGWLIDLSAESSSSPVITCRLVLLYKVLQDFVDHG